MGRFEAAIFGPLPKWSQLGTSKCRHHSGSIRSHPIYRSPSEVCALRFQIDTGVAPTCCSAMVMLNSRNKNAGSPRPTPHAGGGTMTMLHTQKRGRENDRASQLLAEQMREGRLVIECRTSSSEDQSSGRWCRRSSICPSSTRSMVRPKIRTRPLNLPWKT
jgi:hypothetical protein